MDTKYLRKSYGLTQKQLSEIFCCSIRKIQNYDYRRTLPWWQLYLMFEHLDCLYNDWLIGMARKAYGKDMTFFEFAKRYTLERMSDFRIRLDSEWWPADSFSSSPSQ